MVNPSTIMYTSKNGQPNFNYVHFQKMVNPSTIMYTSKNGQPKYIYVHFQIIGNHKDDHLAIWMTIYW